MAFLFPENSGNETDGETDRVQHNAAPEVRNPHNKQRSHSH